MISTTVWAKEKAPVHREHGAHVHGSAKLAIAFDQLQGQIEFRCAAEGVLGFEHKASSAKDKRTLVEATENFDKKINQMIVFDPALGCQIKSDSVGMLPDGAHADFAAKFSVTCQKPVLGSKINFDFTRFSLLKDIDVTILAGDLQLSTEIKGRPATVSLKKVE